MADSTETVKLSHRGLSIVVNLSQANNLDSNKFEEGPLTVSSSNDNLNDKFEFYEGPVTFKDGNTCLMKPQIDNYFLWDSFDYKVSISDDKGNNIISSNDANSPLNSEIFVVGISRIIVSIHITKLVQRFTCQVGKTTYRGNYNIQLGVPSISTSIPIAKRSTVMTSETLYSSSIVNSCYDYTDSQSEGIYIESPQVRCTAPHVAQAYLFRNLIGVENPHISEPDTTLKIARYYCNGPEFELMKETNKNVNSYVYSFSSPIDWENGRQWIRCDGVHLTEPITPSSTFIQWKDKMLSSVQPQAQPKPTPSSTPPLSNSTSSQSSNGTSKPLIIKIKCVKGKTIKTVSGKNPKCPTGYKIKV